MEICTHNPTRLCVIFIYNTLAEGIFPDKSRLIEKKSEPKIL